LYPCHSFLLRMKRSFLISLQRRRNQRQCTGATEGISARQFWRATFSCPSWRPSAGGYRVSRAFTRRELPPSRRHSSARVSSATWRRARWGNKFSKSLFCCLVSARVPLTSNLGRNSSVSRMIVRVILRTWFILRVSFTYTIDRHYSGLTAACVRCPMVSCSSKTESHWRVRLSRYGAHL